MNRGYNGNHIFEGNKNKSQFLNYLEKGDVRMIHCSEETGNGLTWILRKQQRNIRTHRPRLLIGWDVYQKEINPGYGHAYRRFRNDIASEFGKEYENHIKMQSWSTIHKCNLDTLHAYFHHGLKPGQGIPSNSRRNTCYSTDGVRNPRPCFAETEEIIETIIDVKERAVDAGRVGFEVLYGKETDVKPLDGMEGVSSGFRKKFGRYPLGYGNYPEPLPLPGWVYENEPIPPVTIPELPGELLRAIALVQKPVRQLLYDYKDVVEAYALAKPVFEEFGIDL